MNENIKQQIIEVIETHNKMTAELKRAGIETIAAAAETLTRALKQNGTIYLCGNGGSAADAQHIAGEFVGRFCRERKALAAVALSTDTSILTSIANDYTYERVFARQVEALVREWNEHDIARYAAVIAGQEMGSKTQHLSYATKERYKENRVLMIGDAPGDIKAAKENDALFYPIDPGREVESWKRFHDEAFDRFLSGEYAGAYEAGLIAEFDSYLPEKPPWAEE